MNIYSSDFLTNAFQMDLTLTQKRLLENYQSKVNEERMNRIDRIVREKLSEATQRKTSSMLKVRIIDATDPKSTKSPILCIWNADVEQCALYENMLVDMRSVIGNGMRGRDIKLISGKFSTFFEIKSRPIDALDEYKRKLTFLAEITNPESFQPFFNEFDTVGYCFEIDESISGQFQSVFIVDAHKNILCLKFWNGVQAYAYDDIVCVGKFLIFSNLDWRPHNCKNANGFVQAYPTEYTICSECPKSDDRKNAFDHLRNEFKAIDLDQYTNACCEIVRNKNANTPLKPANSTINHRIPAAECSSAAIASHSAKSDRRQSEQIPQYENDLPLLQGFYASARATKTPLRRTLGGSRLRRTQKSITQKENQNN